MSPARLPNAAHQSHPWVMTRVAPDFTLLDVWDLPVEGDADGFDVLLEIVASLDPTTAGPAVSRALFRLRLQLGRWLGWDHVRARPIPGRAETSLSARLPEHLRDSAAHTGVGEVARRIAGGFVPLFRTDDEWAAEVANETVHGVLQLAWVDRGNGRFQGRLGVYVRPRGMLGRAYLTAIGPFRHLVVYPGLLRHIGRAWEARALAAGRTAGEAGLPAHT